MLETDAPICARTRFETTDDKEDGFVIVDMQVVVSSLNLVVVCSINVFPSLESSKLTGIGI